MARSTWKGSLKFSLITIPIRAFPATDAHADVSFHQLHRKCHTQIQLKKWCPHCHREVADDEIVKGYDTTKGRHVIVDEEDIKKLRPESTHTIEITHLLKASAIDPVAVERAQYLAPDSKSAGSPFAVFREALADHAGVGHLALHGRDYVVAVMPRDDALVMYTLRTAGEIRGIASIDGLDFARTKVKPDEVKLARQVLSGFKTATDLSGFTDHYEKALRAMLAHRQSEAAVGAATPGKPAKVVNLMDALRQSLASVNGKQPAKAAGPDRKSARVIAHPSNRTRRKAG